MGKAKTKVAETKFSQLKACFVVERVMAAYITRYS